MSWIRSFAKGWVRRFDQGGTFSRIVDVANRERALRFANAEVSTLGFAENHPVTTEPKREVTELAQTIAPTLSLPEPAEFKDESDNSFELLPGLREKVKPNWRNMFTTPVFVAVPIAEEEKLRYANTKASADSFEKYLRLHGTTIVGKDVLEIICFDGCRSWHVASKGAQSVVGSDLSFYYVTNSMGQHSRRIPLLARLSF